MPQLSSQPWRSGPLPPGPARGCGWSPASLSPEYIAGNVITAADIDAQLAAKQPLLIAFHVVTLTSALLLVVFASGLHRRLRRGANDSLAPVIALTGLAVVAASQMLGTGLDTEFLFGIGDAAINLPSDIGFYSHWIATIPWLWVGGGLGALAVASAARVGIVARWLGIVSTILGAVTLFVALSPLQYMAAGPGILWLLISALGLAAERRKA